MAKKLKEMEIQWRKEKEEANEAFQQERKVKLRNNCIKGFNFYYNIPNW